jgi:hypothetical protein
MLQVLASHCGWQLVGKQHGASSDFEIAIKQRRIKIAYS